MCRTAKWKYVHDAMGAGKMIFLSHFYTKKRSFCQDRLGTNIGKVEKMRCVFCRGRPRCAPRRCSLVCCSEQFSPHCANHPPVAYLCRAALRRASFDYSLCMI
eukprot:COSAG06_NODE_4084_length_4591_cov_2.794524_3_plen_103_part_00